MFPDGLHIPSPKAGIYEPSPVWLAEQVTARKILAIAEAEDWTVSKLVDEFLKVGIVPSVTFVSKK